MRFGGVGVTIRRWGRQVTKVPVTARNFAVSTRSLSELPNFFCFSTSDIQHGQILPVSTIRHKGGLFIF